MKIPQFEHFIAKTGARLGSYYFSITANGSIAIHSGFYYQQNLAQYQSAAILYDKEQKLIGIEFSKDEVKDGYLKLHHSKSGKNASIGARLFFKFYQIIPTDLQGRYKPTKIESSTGKETFMIDLSEKV